MTLPTGEDRTILEQLDALLDEELELLELRRGQIETLIQAVLDRDDETIEPLLEQMGDAQRAQEATDLRLAALRSALAERLGIPEPEVTLNALIDRAAPRERETLRIRRKQIIALVEALRRRQLDAVVLLNESARVNRLMLQSLMPAAEGVTTYGQAGADEWNYGLGLVDAEG